MKVLKFRQLFYSFIIMSLLTVAGCNSNNDGPKPYDGPTKRAVLLYAVASNNLYSNLRSDKAEIIKAANNMNLDGLSMLVYQVAPTGNPQLFELRRIKSDSCEFVPIKEYSRELYSTDPKRISEVIADVKNICNAEKYGLILWSHGTGIDPSFSTHGVVEKNLTNATESEEFGNSVLISNLPLLYSFGSDNDPEKDGRYYDETDIDELAEAIPDNMFDFIWFDACYMSGIETIYQLRNKCDYFVGYPTEVYTPGMPYDLTIPYILKDNPDLKGAAEAFFNYYANHASSTYRVATVVVADVNKIENVADYCKSAYSLAITPDANGLQKYSRSHFGPFYDFGQYTRLMAQSNPDAPSVEEFDAVMDNFVVYKAATDKDFNFNPISPENYSGISCYCFSETDSSDKALFYHTLDWYKRVYPQIEE